MKKPIAHHRLPGLDGPFLIKFDSKLIKTQGNAFAAGGPLAGISVIGANAFSQTEIDIVFNKQPLGTLTLGVSITVDGISATISGAIGQGGNIIRYTITTPLITDNDPVVWSYSQDIGNIVDSDGKELKDTVYPVRNIIDTKAPTLQTAEIGTEGSNIFTLVFSEAIRSTDFSLGWSATADLASLTFTGGQHISGNTLYLTVAEYITEGQSVLISYNSAVGDIQDRSGYPNLNDLASFTDFAVTNNVVAGPDTEVPLVDNFVANSGAGISTSLTIPINILDASDNVSAAVDMQYMITTNPASPPSPNNPNWDSYANRLNPFTVPNDGIFTVTAYAKDEADNVSRGLAGAQQTIQFDTIAPVLNSAIIDSAGTTLTLNFSEPVVGNIGFTLTAEDIEKSLTAPINAGTQIIFTCALIGQGETCKLDYTAGDVTDIATNPLANFVNRTVTNNSTQNAVLDLHSLIDDPLTYEMHGILIGQEVLLENRLSLLLLEDYEGVFREFPNYYPGYSKGRNVRNIALNNNSSLYSTDNLLDTTRAGVDVSFNLADGYTEATIVAISDPTLFWRQSGVYGGFDYPADRVYRLSFSAKGVGPSIGKIILLIVIENGDVIINQDQFILSGAWQRFSVITPVTNQFIKNILFSFNYNEANIGLGEIVHIKNLQIEDVSGQSNTNPGEYVPVKVANASDVNVVGIIAASDWVSGGNTITDEGDGSVSIEYVDTATATLNLSAIANQLTTIGRYWIIDLDIKVNTGSVTLSMSYEFPSFSKIITATDYLHVSHAFFYQPSGALTLDILNLGAGQKVYINNVTVKITPHGTGMPDMKIFANQNGNTVGGTRIVTEALGAPLAEIPYLTSVPQATNGVLYSQNLAAWAKTTSLIVTPGQQSITGFYDAYTIEDPTASYEYAYQAASIPCTAGVQFTVVAYIKKTGSGIAAIQLGVGGENYTAQLNPADGAVFDEGGDLSGFESQDKGNYWKLVFSGPTTIGTSAQIYLHPGRTHNLGGPPDATATGANTFDQVQFFDNTPFEIGRLLPPIHTSGAAVTRTKCNLAIDKNNHNVANKAYYLEYDTNLMAAFTNPTDTDPKILRFGNNNGQIAQQASSANIRAFDGVTYSTPAGGPSLGENKIGLVHAANDNLFSLNLNGVWDDKAFDGTFGIDADINIGFNFDHVVKIRNLQGYAIGNFQLGKSVIDGLIP